MHVVMDITAQKCTITSINPAELTDAGGILQDGMPNVTIECSCSNDMDTEIPQIRWFFPNGSKVKRIANTPDGSPYFKRVSYSVATLIIPVFSADFKGKYTCKPINGFNSNSPMYTLQLLLGELYYSCLIFDSLYKIFYKSYNMHVCSK